MVRLAGSLYNDAGAALASASVAIFPTSVSADESTGTGSATCWRSRPAGGCFAAILLLCVIQQDKTSPCSGHAAEGGGEGRRGREGRMCCVVRAMFGKGRRRETQMHPLNRSPQTCCS